MVSVSLYSIPVGLTCLITLALCGFVALIQTGTVKPLHPDKDKANDMDPLSPDEQQKRQRGLGQARWWAVYGIGYDDGYCTNTGTYIHGSSPTFASKEDCCKNIFPNQSSNRCMPVVEESPLDPVPNSAPTPTQTTPTQDAQDDSSNNFDDAPDLSVPDNCQNLPKYENGAPIEGQDWIMPADSVWKDTPFSGMTCTELAQDIAMDQPAEVQKFCKFLSQGIYSGPCAIEACCFCGGGDHTFQPRCENMEWNSMADATGSALNCEFVDTLPVEKQGNFCQKYGGASFTEDRLTLSEACCACGGGHRHYNHLFAADEERLQGHRKLQDDSTATAAILPDGTNVIDYTYRVGAGDSPGITNLEYLGLGYDMIRGNPRGSDTSELDPGFRYRVLRLEQAQTNLTVDGEYMVPFGTAVKYTSSCKYDSSSVEISSESDLRRALSREAATASSSTSTTREENDYFFYSETETMTKSHSFAQSAKFESIGEANRKASSVSFEARAICSEFEASFIPGFDHKLSPEFGKALGSLPVPYNSENKRHRVIWKEFFVNFGTNYVKYLILGGKRIESTSMSQQDYSSLVSNAVDVASTMSFEMSAAMGSSAGVKAGLVKGVAGGLAALGPKGAAIGSVVNVALSGADDSDNVFGSETSESSSSSLANFASSKAQAENAFQISKKKLTTQEYTIGGLPFDDWREWAASVKEKPMPIKYELGSLMDFMSYEQSVAFIAGVQDFYAIDLSIELQGPILEGTSRHGVYSGPGEPLSLSTLDPNDDYRVLMQNDITALDGGSSSPRYDSAAVLDGVCIDSFGRSYSSIKIDYPDGQGVREYECIEKCQTLGALENQVGIYYHLIASATLPTAVGTEVVMAESIWSLCHCLYDADALPDFSSTASGTGSVFDSTGAAGKCYPNQAYSSTGAGIFTYSDIWKGKTTKPIALFATPIRGSIAPNAKEDPTFPFSISEKVTDPWNNHVYFALTKDINSNGVLGVTNFGDLRSTVVTNDELPSFSFLSVDALRLHGSDFLSGVVAYNGLIQNQDGRRSFDVEMDELTTTIITFKNHIYDSNPTVLAFPNWLGRKETNYPQLIQDLNFAINEISSSGFTIAHETQPTSTASYLGFNFLVIGPNMATDNIKHGIVYECSHLSAKTSSTYGFTVVTEQEGCSNPTNLGDDHRGVKIQFDSEFSDIPSVIVTPFTTIEWRGAGFVPRCIVETITSTFTRVKCGLVDEKTDTYQPIPFSFLAVGYTV